MQLDNQTRTYSAIRYDGAQLYLSASEEKIIYGQKLTGEEKFQVQKITAYQHGKAQLQNEVDWLLESADWKLTSWDGRAVIAQ